MQKRTFAIIGCGRIAERHAAHIHSMAHLAAVCDIKPDRLKVFADQYGCAAYGSIEQLLASEPSVEVVSICTPNYLHAEHTIAALNAGKHVLCEKPMALSTEDCHRMIAASEQSGKKLFIVKQNRFNPPVVAVKKALDEGRLGRIVNVQLNCFWNRNRQYYEQSDWKGRKAFDGGTLYTQFSHFIDLMYWMAGDIKNLHALTGNTLHNGIIEFEDTGAIALEFANGAFGTINYTVNSFEKNLEGSLTLFGENGTVKIGGQYLNTLEYQRIAGFEFGNIPQSAKPNDYGFYQGSMSNHDKVYQNILDVLNHNHAIATSGEEGLKTVEIIERIYAGAAGRNQ